MKTVNDYRRDLHQIPEIGDFLPKTKNYIMDVLSSMDGELTELLDSGLAIYFDRGKEETTAFRADMDALPIEEASGVDFESKYPGVMHACGHDAHMAMCLALADKVNSCPDLATNVLIFFQPAEETIGGAERICKTGLFDKYKVTKVYGIHMHPCLETGRVFSRPGVMQPSSAQIDIEITGKATHATTPEKGKDSIFIGVELVSMIKKRHLEYLAERGYHDDMGGGFTINPPLPEDRTIIQICKFNSGTARNIIPGSAHLTGTIRAYSEDKFADLVKLIETCCKKIARRFEVDINFSHSKPYPPVINDPDLFEEVLPALKKNLDFEIFEKPALISEDYSYYGKHAKSIFFFLGTGYEDALHSSSFKIKPEALEQGVKLYSTLLNLK